MASNRIFSVENKTKTATQKKHVTWGLLKTAE